MLKKYLLSEDALNASVEQILLLVLTVIGVVIVGYMIYNGIKKVSQLWGKISLWEDKQWNG